jgi:hypothetical protein
MVMSSNDKDRGQIVYPLADGTVLVGGSYYLSNGTFSTLHNHGLVDLFLAVFAPWAANITDSKKNKFSVYPNPTQNTLHINSSIRLSDYVISITDTQGRTIKSTNIKSNTYETTIDVGDLDNGNYVIKISENNNVIFSKIIAISK